MIPYIVFITCTLVWIFPPFRQYRTKYFWFFLILAIVDPVRDIFYFGFRISLDKQMPVFALLALLALIKRSTKVLTISSILVLIYFFFMGNLSMPELRALGILLQTLILIAIINDFLLYTAEHKTVNLFYILLIMYQIMVVYKFISTILDVNNGVVIFYLSTFIQIFFGVLFTIINVNSKNFRIVKDLDKTF